MIALIQRVKSASVEVDGKIVASIPAGMLVFVGVEKGDTAEKSLQLFNKLKSFRMFADENDKMNLNIEQIKGEILLVPQFTLAAVTSKGNRPGFDTVAPHSLGKQLFEMLVEYFQNDSGIPVQTGIFQANMQVSLVNDGPITFWLEK